MRKFLVAGNWKMNGDKTRNRELVAGIIAGSAPSEAVEVLVCPPFPYLDAVADQADGSHVMVGHSERRTLYGETDDQVAAKFRAALDAGLTPILCVGETLEEREAMQTESVTSRQLAAVVAATGIEAFSRAVIAYEPVWAIGTGRVATPEQAQDVHLHIRGMLSAENAEVAAGVQLLYGGSMKGENASGLLSMPDIDGGLIGGASLKSADFLAIVEAAAEVAGN